jgi:hypothetical protein
MCLNACVNDETWLWYIRLRHVNFDSLKMVQKEMLKSLPSIIHQISCEGCLMGKQFHKSFLKKSTSRASQPPQKIHVSVCGPIKSY